MGYLPFGAVNIYGTILILLITPGVFALGDLVSKSWTKHEMVATRLLVDYVVGTFVAIVMLLVGGLLDVLVPVEYVLGGLTAVATVVWVVSAVQRSKGLPLPSLQLQNLVTSIVFAGYVVKVCLMLVTKPIQDSDAMTQFIPTAKTFAAYGGIPSFDPYHYHLVSAEPAVPLLYSWAIGLSGSLQSEAFRVIPIAAFVALPLAVYVFIFEVFNNRFAASVALILTVFLPALDLLLYFYAFYLDAFAIVFMLSAWTFARRVPSQGYRAELMVGVSLGAALVTKYDYGIFATLVVVLLLIPGLVKNARTAKVVRTLATLGMSILFVLVAEKIGFLSVDIATISVVAVAIVCLFVLSIIWEAGSKTEIGLKGLSVMAVPLIPALVWQARSLAIGASLFGTGLLRLYPSPPSSIPPPDTFSIALYSSLLLHPYYNLLFLPISALSIAYALTKRTSREVLTLLLLYLVYFLTAIGDPSSGRHLLVGGVLLVGVVAFFLSDLKVAMTGLWKYIVVLYFCFSSMLAWPTFYYYLQEVGAQSIGKTLGVVSYQASFSNGNIITMLVSYGVPYWLLLGGALFLAYLVVPRLDRLKAIRLPRKALVPVVIALVIMGSALQFIPYLGLALVETHGDISDFSSVGSYFYIDQTDALRVVSVVPSNDTILTFGNPELDLYFLRSYDLVYSGTYYIQEILQQQNGSTISALLIKNGIDYLVLPSTNNYEFDSYVSYTDNTPILRELLTSVVIAPVNLNLQDWVLYKIV